MAMTHPALLFLLLVTCTGAARGFYLPGVAPVDFRKNDLLTVQVSQLSSIKTQLPYSYYSLPFCGPDTIINSAENLGEVLRGDRIENSLYVFEMMEPKLCQIACKIVLTQQEAEDFREKIEDDYRVNMILDNLPMVVPIKRLDKEAPPYYQQGFHVGVKGYYAGAKDVKYFIHNHLSFLVKYNKDAHANHARIVAFEVMPYSVKHEYDGDWKANATRLKTCNPHSRRLVVSSDWPQEIEANKEIIFTYDVNFESDPLAVKVNQLSSIKTQLPYSYYSLPFCRPGTIVDSAENLGEVLRGDRIENSLYVFEMMEPRLCQIVCRITLGQDEARDLKEKIDDEYRINMILDNLPLVVPIKRLDQEAPTVYQQGVHVGIKGQYSGSKEEKHFIHNHFTFLVKYHKDANTDLARIVAFEVKPFSIKHEYDGDWKGNSTPLKTCDPHSRRLVVDSDSPQEVEASQEIVFTYDVNFEESPIKWASRWDTYLLMADDQIHWFSIVNSLMIVLFLSGMVAMIMLRTLYRDISKYNQLEDQEDAQEETGWKLVHGDVFRPPVNADLLCIYVGTGVQFFGMLLVTLLFAILGLLSPSNRGGLMTAMLLLWVFMGLFAGYSSSRLYKMFKGSDWKNVTIKTALMFPGTVFAIFFVLNALIWGEKSSGAVPFTTMFALVLLWFGISMPLVFVGSYLGFKKPAIEDPVRTNKIPRAIPEQPWYMNPVVSVLIGGILPFGAVFIELFFILTSIWLHQFYYIFGFLFLVFVILILTCAEITIVLCYFQLCGEDYQWWWRSYLTSGSSALYLFLYATFYFFTKLEITKTVSGVLYFGYMLIASYAFFVLTGTIGFYACFWFTRLIYSSVKID
ncbi:hypothetical protein U9M48_026783 [Paspalum notatum var. saurae]|uniref:Transmembrane 9 superfamily member n=1 Tax=Paspalum notatum var. saurae TaxID=547442 RepID=A0AAQ3TTE8_PASNO